MCSPDQLSHDGFEDRFNGVVFVAIPLASYRNAKFVLAQNLLIIVLTFMVSLLGVMEAAFGR